MTWDAIAAVAACSAGAGVPSGSLRCVAYLAAGALLFEFAIFLRTDMYYVVTNVLRLGNLMEDTRRWLANAVARMVRRAPARSGRRAAARERRTIPWFAVVMVVGVASSVGSSSSSGSRCC